MKFGILLAGAALVGAGYLVGRKVFGHNIEVERKGVFTEDTEGETSDGAEAGASCGCCRCDADGTDSAENTESTEGETTQSKHKNYKEALKKASLFTVGAIKTGADKLVETVKEVSDPEKIIGRGESAISAAKIAGTNIKNDLAGLRDNLREEILADIEDIKQDLRGMAKSAGAAGAATADGVKKAADVVVDSVVEDAPAEYAKQTAQKEAAETATAGAAWAESPNTYPVSEPKPNVSPDYTGYSV